MATATVFRIRHPWDATLVEISDLARKLPSGAFEIRGFPDEDTRPPQPVQSATGWWAEYMLLTTASEDEVRQQVVDYLGSNENVSITPLVEV